MKYGENEQYVRHVDYYNREERFFGHDLEKFGGQRIKTALLYLTTAEEGGETVFHKAVKENSVGKNSCAGKCGPLHPCNRALYSIVNIVNAANASQHGQNRQPTSEAPLSVHKLALYPSTFPSLCLTVWERASVFRSRHQVNSITAHLIHHN